MEQLSEPVITSSASSFVTDSSRDPLHTGQANISIKAFFNVIPSYIIRPYCILDGQVGQYKLLSRDILNNMIVKNKKIKIISPGYFTTGGA